MYKKILLNTFLVALVLLLFGNLVVGDIGSVSMNTVTTTTGSNSTILKAAENMVLNITVSMDTTYRTNITAFNITLVNDLTFLGFVGSCSTPGAAEGGDGGNTYHNQSDFVTNATCWPSGIAATEWGCYNVSATQIFCNTTNDVSTGAGGPLGEGMNTSIMIRVNVTTSSSSVETTKIGFNLTTVDSASVLNFTEINTTYLDGQAPRITNFNITDGNFTLLNGTHLEKQGKNTVEIDNGYFFDGDVPLTVTATVTDIAVEKTSLILYYYSNSTQQAIVPHSTKKAYSGTASATTKAMGSNFAGIYTWTIPAAGLAQNDTLSFLIESNDTTGHFANLTAFGAGGGSAWNISVNRTLVPKITKWNVTEDGTGSDINWVSNANGFVRPGRTLTLYVDVEGLNISGSDSSLHSVKNNTVRIFYTNDDTHGNGTAIWNETLDSGIAGTRGLKEVNLTNMTKFNTSYAKATWTTTIGTSDHNIADGGSINFVIIVETNPLELNYTAHQAGPNNLGFNLTIDGTAPTVSTPTTTDADKTIEVSNSITYTCSAGDGAGSGIDKYRLVLDKPGQSAATDTGYQSSASHTFTGTDTNKAGTYIVHCYCRDNVKNVGTSTDTFTVQYSSGSGSGGSSSSGGGGGSGGTTTTITVDADLSVEPSQRVTITQGASRSFTLDGSTQHRVTVNELSAISATITITSDPVTITLSVGESKLVDMDGDGINDVKVTLNKIDGSNADITIEKLALPKQEAEKKAAAEAAVGGPAEPVKDTTGLTWLWWLIGLIVILAILYFVFGKKKK